jgi:hypothetical protein
VRLAERSQILQSISRAWLDQTARSRDDMVDNRRRPNAAGYGAPAFVAVERFAP